MTGLRALALANNRLKDLELAPEPPMGSQYHFGRLLLRCKYFLSLYFLSYKPPVINVLSVFRFYALSGFIVCHQPTPYLSHPQGSLSLFPK